MTDTYLLRSGELSSEWAAFPEPSLFTSGALSSPSFYRCRPFRPTDFSITLHLRLTISETPRYTLDVERNVLGAAADIDAVVNTGHFNTHREDEVIHKVEAPKATWADFGHYIGQWKNGKILLGAAWSWFA